MPSSWRGPFSFPLEVGRSSVATAYWWPEYVRDRQAGVTGRRPFRRRGRRFPFCPRPPVGGVVVDAGRRKAVPLTTGRGDSDSTWGWCSFSVKHSTCLPSKKKKEKDSTCPGSWSKPNKAMSDEARAWWWEFGRKCSRFGESVVDGTTR